MSRIVWTCKECGKPIADGAGYVEMPTAEIARYRDQEEELARKYPTVDEHGQRRFAAIPITEVPDSATWHALHAKCDPEPEGSSWYWFDVDRIRTVEQLCAWTIHLSEKNWYLETTWSRVAHSKLTQLGSPAYRVMK